MMRLGALLGVLQLAAGHPIHRDMVSALRGRVSWQVHDVDSNPLSRLSAEELRGMVRTSARSSGVGTSLERSRDLPVDFDPRSGGCVHPIRDQKECGSCWAFGATEALSDRFCLAGKEVVLAPQDMVSCDVGNNGCDGGYLEEAWEYLTETGAVPESCWPYKGKDHCRSSCAIEGEAWTKFRCIPGTVSHPVNTEDIQRELYVHGPMEGAFTVYEDFFSYRGGVYYHSLGNSEGGHAIKVVGWGHEVETGLDYWLCANSWGTAWGEKGFFKIKMGDSGINEMMYGCLPDVEGGQLFLATE